MLGLEGYGSGTDDDDEDVGDNATRGRVTLVTDDAHPAEARAPSPPECEQTCPIRAPKNAQSPPSRPGSPRAWGEGSAIDERHPLRPSPRLRATRFPTRP